MKVITTNRLNRFWKNGVLSIKNALATKLNTSSVVNNLLTTAAGYALDARQGKALDDKITALNGKLAWKRTRALYIIGFDTYYDCVVPNDANEVLIIFAPSPSSTVTMPGSNRATLVIPRTELANIYDLFIYFKPTAYVSFTAGFRTNGKVKFTSPNIGSEWVGVHLFVEVYYR